MTQGIDSPDTYRDVIAEMRQLARERIEAPSRLVEVQQRIAKHRQQSGRKVLEALATHAQVDLKRLFEEELRAGDEVQRELRPALDTLEAEAKKRAQAQRAVLHRARAQHRHVFPSALPLGEAQLKFRHPFSWHSDARPSSCNRTYGVFWEPHTLGPFEATAEMTIGQENEGVWLYPYIYGNNGHCWGPTTASTIHELVYHMPAPQSSFAVQHVRADLIGNGVGSGVEGTTTSPFPWFGFQIGPPASVHLDVQVGQQVDNEWHTWPLISEQLFNAYGDYVRQIRLVLSAQTFPSSLRIRTAAAGGGPLLCFVQLSCSAWPAGTHGHVKLDFRAPDLGIFLGGVALIGKYDQPLLEA